MSLDRALYASAVFIYAVGGEHHYREPCRQLVAAMRDGPIDAEASSLVIQELIHQRTRRTGSRLEAADTARDVAGFCTLHPLTAHDVGIAIGLFADTDDLDAADACHAATAVNRDIATIVSPGRAFDAVAGLTRIDPVDAAAMLV